MAKVSIRTVRFYDKQNILKPSYVNESGARFYTDSDFARLQQILLLKYLGFSLDDIKELLVDDLDTHFLRNSLKLQKQLVQDRMEQMELVSSAIDKTVYALEQEQDVDWSQMLDLIHLTGMEKSLKSQYQNASNISARIRLHRDYSVNKQGWFPWIFEQCMSIVEALLASGKEEVRILEVGCGNGALWAENKESLPSGVHVTLSDVSDGMIRDVRRTLGARSKVFEYKVFDCNDIPYEDGSFDIVIANHVLFYCDDIPAVCHEIRRVLRPEGSFICSTYGSKHMKEITELVQEFDSRIMLSAEHLYEGFGLENGKAILEQSFSSVEQVGYEDEIIIDSAEPLIEYILSCHGNQNQFLLDRYHDFRQFVEKKTQKKFHITKDAGLFVCK